MKKLLLVAGAALALGTAGTSFAAALAAPSGNTGVLPGFYVGLGAGIGGMDTPKLDQNDLAFLGAYETSYKLRNGVAARGYLGYLWAIPQTQYLKLGAELGYNYYPKNKYTAKYIGLPDESWDYKGWNVDLLAVGKYNFGDTGFNVIGKAGPAYVSQDLNLNADQPGVGYSSIHTGSKHKVRAEVAAGVGYDFNKNIDVNLVFSHVFGNKPAKPADLVGLTNAEMKNRLTKVAPVDTLLLTAAYHFGNIDGLA